MRLPNGYGSVYKLSGNRRKPWAARVTTGWTFEEEEQKSYPIYKFVGYFPTRKEALAALAKYHEDPFDFHRDTITFEEVFDRWSDEYFETATRQNINRYSAVYRLCEPLYKMKYKDIKLDHMQKVVDESGKNTPTLKNLKALFGVLCDYAIKHEIVTADKRQYISYVDISKPGNPNARSKQRFSNSEVEHLWQLANAGNADAEIILVLIYSGVRINELLTLKKEFVNLKEHYFRIVESKTEAGLRDVPIADKIMPFVQKWYDKKSDYLLCQENGKRIIYRTFAEYQWEPLMQQLGTIDHKPHDTRRTCISLLTEAEVDPRILRQIVGHKGTSIAEKYYTDIALSVKLAAINKI